MKLVHIAAEPVFMPSGKELQATVSIGMSYFPKDGESAETLLRKADDAMFAAKSAGRNRWLAALSA
jgi:diguanylate cyclase (GGDEF)-like protein